MKGDKFCFTIMHVDISFFLFFYVRLQRPIFRVILWSCGLQFEYFNIFIEHAWYIHNGYILDRYGGIRLLDFFSWRL